MPSILGLHRSRVLCRIVQGVGGLLLTAVPAVAQTQLWIDFIGSESNDEILASASDGSGGVFAAGYVGMPPVGLFGYSRTDVLLGRYDAEGTLLWIRRFGSGGTEEARAAVPDGLGGVFLAGVSFYSGDGVPQLPQAWMGHFDALGKDLWISPLPQFTQAVHGSPDGAGGYLLCGTAGGGFGPDSWMARFDASGALLWTKQLNLDPTNGDEATCVVSDGQGGAFVCGFIWVTNFLDDAWIARVNSSGDLLWSVELVTPKLDHALALLPDGQGGVYVGGKSGGSLGGPTQGTNGAWLARFDGSGGRHWLMQPAELNGGAIKALATDGAGGLLAGMQFQNKARLSRFDGAGQLVYMHTVEPAKSLVVRTMCSDGGEGAFIAGSTALIPPQVKPTDIWLARYDGSCNSGTIYCVASSTSIPGCQASISATGSPTLSDPTAWTVSTGPVPGANLGLLLFGSSGKDNTPYGTLGGKLCVASPTFRTAPKSSGGDQGQCNGSYVFTLADLIAASPIVTSGATINAHVWARDPANVDGFLLSDGIEVTVCT